MSMYGSLWSRISVHWFYFSKHSKYTPIDVDWYCSLPVWPDCCTNFSIFGHFQQWKFAQYNKRYFKVGSKFCRLIKIGQILLKFCPNGEISPNLVTLFTANRDNWFITLNLFVILFQILSDWGHHKMPFYYLLTLSTKEIGVCQSSLD